MKTYKTHFGKLTDKSNSRSVTKIIKSIKQSEKENYEIFRTKPKEYSIILVKNKSEFEKLSKVNYAKGRGAATLNNKIILLSPETERTSFSINKTIFHEVNHIFYRTLTKTYKPLWLSEGMATYLMKEYAPDKKSWTKYFKSINCPEKFLFYDYRKKRQQKHVNEFFTLSYLTYEFMEIKFGRSKIIDFLKRFSKSPTKQNFEKQFKNFFKTNKKEIVRQTLENYK